MRHVFLIHNGITSVMARSIPHHEGVPLSDCVGLIDRGQGVPDGMVGAELTGFDLTVGRNVPRFRRELRRLDGRLTEAVDGGAYHAYLPGLFTEQMMVVATHPLCRAVSLMEEGTGSLLPAGWRYSQRAGPANALQRLVRGRRFPAHGADCRAMLSSAFFVSPEGYPDWPQWQRRMIKPLIGPGDQIIGAPGESAVLVVEPLPEGRRMPVPIERYLEVLSTGLQLLVERGFTRVAVKYHPNNGSDIRHSLAQMLEAVQIDVVVLPSTAVLEDYVRSDGPLFVGVASSALHYAVLFGGRAATLVDAFDDDRGESLFRAMIPASTRDRIERWGRSVG